MTGSGDIAAVVERIGADPTILGLGDLDLKRVSVRAAQVGLLLEDPVASILHVAEIQLGPTDDRQVIRLVERWAAERKRQRTGRCYGVLVAETIDPRCVNILRLVAAAVPVVAVKMDVGPENVRFTPVPLR